MVKIFAFTALKRMENVVGNAKNVFVVLCEYSEFRIELNSLVTIHFYSKPIQLFKIFEYLFKRVCERKGLCLSKKTWLSAALLLTIVLTLDSS